MRLANQSATEDQTQALEYLKKAGLLNQKNDSAIRSCADPERLFSTLADLARSSSNPLTKSSFDFDNVLQGLKLSYMEIRKNARLIALDQRSNTGLFNKLPTELLVKIVGLTRDPVTHGSKSSEKIALKYLCKLSSATRHDDDDVPMDTPPAP